MNELEFDRLLDAVSDAFNKRPFDSLWSAAPLAPPAAANDNDLTWAMVPFPDGWHASC